MRGTSGELRHPRRSRYRCSLPGLAGFAGPRCAEPEVPRSGTRAQFPASAEKSLAHSIAEELWSKLLFRYVSQSLSINSTHRAAIQLTMIGNRKCLSRSVREDSTQFNVASPL